MPKYNFSFLYTAQNRRTHINRPKKCLLGLYNRPIYALYKYIYIPYLCTYMYCKKEPDIHTTKNPAPLKAILELYDGLVYTYM